MEFKGITYVGEEVSDKETLEALPAELKSFYEEINGLVAYQGGLHIRGCVVTPEWHSLAHVWKGEHALWKIFSDLNESDIPFAQDCMGDQFVLRLGTVWLLSMDTGELDDLEIEFYDFLEDAIEDPVEFWLWNRSCSSWIWIKRWSPVLFSRQILRLASRQTNIS